MKDEINLDDEFDILTQNKIQESYKITKYLLIWHSKSFKSFNGSN